VSVSGSRQSPRATRGSGPRTRAALLDAAAAALRERGFAVSAAEVAERAGCFPSQVTYYFGTKEALLAEAACRELLRLAAAVEAAARRADGPREWVRWVVDTVVAGDELTLFAQAQLLARQRPELRPLVTETLARLHTEGARAAVETLGGAGWRIRGTPEAEARVFWATAMGAALEAAVAGSGFDRARAEETLLLAFNLPPGEDS
jgi:AcrR family transcriptional regulator